MSAQIPARTAGRPRRPRRPRARRERLATLVTMTRTERARRFVALQRGMLDVWAAGAGREGASVVVVPSRGVDKWQETPAETRAYEERLLCLLLLLRQPGLHVVYVTSEPVAPAIVDYYLSLLPDVVPDDARARLTLLCADDASPRPLSEKLLDRPLLVHRIRRAIPNRDLAHLIPYCPTSADCDLALMLGIPMYAADPRHARFGTKSGCRELFAQEGVAHPLGEENVASLQDAAGAIARIRAARPDVRELVVKLDEGVSGDGNAIVDVRGLPRPGAAGELPAIMRRLRAMAFAAAGASLAPYVAKLEARGGIVEERIVAAQMRSPSVQLQITPAGEIEVISTHDQLLGGPSGQSFLGASFPADRAYARSITEQALTVAARLAGEGVIGRFAIDFVVVREADGGWRSYAIEINLRKGATTHPFLALQLLTGGSYDPVRARFTLPAGGCRHMVATDHLKIAQLRDLGLDELLGIFDRRGLRFDHACGGGVVLHMLSAASGAGRLGVTAIADTPGAATRLAERVAAVLREEACAASGPARAPARAGGLLRLPALVPGPAGRVP